MSVKGKLVALKKACFAEHLHTVSHVLLKGVNYNLMCVNDFCFLNAGNQLCLRLFCVLFVKVGCKIYAI